MFAHLIVFTFGPNMRFAAEMIADQYLDTVKSQNGFMDITFLIDDHVGEYGALSIWETKKDAEMANDYLYPSLRESLGNIVKSAPDIRIFEVYQPAVNFVE